MSCIRERPRLKIRINGKKNFINNMENVTESPKEKSPDSSAAVQMKNGSVETVPNRNEDDCLRISDIVFHCVRDFASHKVLRYLTDNYEVDEEKIILRVETTLQEYVKAGWLKPKNSASANEFNENEVEEVKKDGSGRKRRKKKGKKSKEKATEPASEIKQTSIEDITAGILLKGRARTHEELKNNERGEIEDDKRTHFKNRRSKKKIIPFSSKETSYEHINFGLCMPNSRVSTDGESKHDDTENSNERKIDFKNNESRISVIEPVPLADKSTFQQTKFEWLMPNSTAGTVDILKNYDAEKFKKDSKKYFENNTSKMAISEPVPLANKSQLEQIKFKWLSPNSTVGSHNISKNNEAEKHKQDSKNCFENNASTKAKTEPVPLANKSPLEQVKFGWLMPKSIAGTDDALKNNELENIMKDNENYFDSTASKKTAIEPAALANESSIKQIKFEWHMRNSTAGTDNTLKNNESENLKKHNENYFDSTASKANITEPVALANESSIKQINFEWRMPNSTARTDNALKKNEAEKFKENSKNYFESNAFKTEPVPIAKESPLEQREIVLLMPNTTTAADDALKINEVENVEENSDNDFEDNYSSESL